MGGYLAILGRVPDCNAARQIPGRWERGQIYRVNRDCESGETPMLKHVATSRAGGERQRKWFADDDFDLIVWFGEDGGIWGFQFCYDHDRAECALTWTTEAGYSHDRVDDGEPNPTKNRTPILVPDGQFASDEIMRRFHDSSAELETAVRDFIFDKLRGYPRSGSCWQV